MPTTHTKDPAAVAMGSRTSPAKAASSARNGRLGGGPGNPMLRYGPRLRGAAEMVLRAQGHFDHGTECSCHWCELRAVLADIEGAQTKH